MTTIVLIFYYEIHLFYQPFKSLFKTYHLKEGIGLPTALQLKVTSSPAITIMSCNGSTNSGRLLAGSIASSFSAAVMSL